MAFSIRRVKKLGLTIRRPRKVQILVGVMLSFTWIAGVLISLPPVSSQLCRLVVAIYCSAGVLIIAAAIYFLHLIDEYFFGSLRTAAPLGAVFVAIVGLFAYLISAEREARRPFLDKQLEDCVRLAEAAAKLPTSPGTDAHLTNWEDAWNRLSIFSDANLESIHSKFVYLDEHHSGNMRDNALCVARMCRVMVHAPWSVIPGLVAEDPRQEPICQELNKVVLPSSSTSQSSPSR